MIYQITDSKILLKFSYSEYSALSDSTRSWIRRNFKWDNGEKIWISRDDIVAFDFEFFPDELNEEFNQIKQQVKAMLSVNVNSNELIESRFGYLYNFQKRLLLEVEAKINKLGIEGIGIFWDTGTGKTVTSLSLAEYLIQRGKVDAKKILILVPASLIQQWKQSILKFGLGSEDEIEVVHGAKNKRNWDSGKKWQISSYDTFRVDASRDEEAMQERLKDAILILDEASKLKNSSAKITKLIKKMAPLTKFRIVLTATPYETGPFNIYNIMKVIKANWISYPEYKRKFVEWDVVWTPNGSVDVPTGLKNLEELRRRIQAYSDRKRKEDVKEDLPPITYEWRHVELTAQQKRLSKELVDRAEKFIEVATLLKMLDNGVNELSQSDSELVHGLNIKEEQSKKLAEVQSIIDEINGYQCLIFTQFERSAKEIYEHLTANFKDKKVAILTGSTKNKDEVLNKFKNKEIQILVATDAISYGVDLPDVDYLINYDLLYNPAKMHQRSQRIYRITSKSAKTVINIVGGGVERSVYEILKERDKTFKFLIDGVGESLDSSEIMRELAKKYGFDN